MDSNSPLYRVWTELKVADVGQAISEMETYLSAWPQLQTTERLQEVKADYALMTDYWRRGADDPHLDENYTQLLQRVYVIFANVAVHLHIQNSSFLSSAYSSARRSRQSWALSDIRSGLETFVADVAMLELEPWEQREQKSQSLYDDHQRQMNALFCFILTSRMWSNGVGRDFEAMLLSPTVDVNDQQLIISAVMLSLMGQFDIVKFRLLTRVYMQATDEKVRQRALVGWVLGLNSDLLAVYPEQRQLTEQLTASAEVCQELTELQMQLVFCLNAEKDTNTIQKEIMPDLLKSGDFRISEHGIEEVEEDPMEEMLNPDASEQRMQRVEASFERMKEMQQQGADIYFGGFSQMKRFSFFNDVANWFVPFFMKHPGIRRQTEQLHGNRFIEKMTEVGPFCNSDKYSLVMAMQMVMDRLPEKVREMLKRGEATMGGEVEHEELLSAAYLRRSYLMDLYRFFRLFPYRGELPNPFASGSGELAGCDFFSSPLLAGTPIEGYKDQVVRLLRRRHMLQSMQILLDSYDEAHRGVDYFIWNGQYEQALALEPDNSKALQGLARQEYALGKYQEAISHYDELLERYPERLQFMLYKAICLLHLTRYDEALHVLYEINYKHPDDRATQSVLAWTLVCSGRMEQALKTYEQLMGDKCPDGDNDWQNYGYCLWLAGRTDEAAEAFRKFYKFYADDRLTGFPTERTLLEAHGITDTQVKLMRSLILAC